jgi:hypothetical protein
MTLIHKMNVETQRVFDKAVKAMADFKRTFGRDLTPSLLAELYVALELDLSPVSAPNTPGFDLLSSDGKRYQVKQRSPKTLNIDINNFDFDYLVLVNMSEDYHPTGIWQLEVAKARSLFVYREKFRKYQTTQKSFKNVAESIKIKIVI